jgi:hypothetical protein
VQKKNVRNKKKIKKYVKKHAWKKKSRVDLKMKIRNEK